MAVDSARFAVSLVDGVSRPAKKSAKSLNRLQDEMRQTERSIMRLGRMQKRAAARESKFNRERIRNASKFQRTMARSNRASSKRGGGMGGGMLMGGAAALGIGAAYGAARGAGALVGRSSQTQRHIFALQKLTGQGEQTYGRLQQMSTTYGLGIDDTAEAYKKFMSGGFEGAQAEKFLKLGADMKALGNNAEQTKGIFLAISQMKALGRVSAEELNQLSERNVGRARMAENIAKILGKSQEETGKLLDQGKVSSAVGLQAVEMTIRDMTGGKDPGEAGKEAATKLMGGMFARMSAQAGVFWDKLGQDAAPGIMKGLRSFGAGMSEFFDSDRGASVLERMGEAATQFGNALAVIGEWAPKALDAFVSGFDTTKDLTGLSADKMEVFKQLLNDSLPLVTNLGRAVGLVADALSRAAWAVEKISSISSTISDSKLGKIAGYGLGAAANSVTGGISGAMTALVANDKGGMVTSVAGGSAKIVRAAPGEGLASIGVGERIMPANQNGSGVSVGDINISVTGGGDAEETGRAVMREFESKFAELVGGYNNEVFA